MVVHFDNAMRLLVERDPARLCAFLLGRTAAELAGTTRLEAELSARPVRADSVLSLPGPPHLVHIEFQLHARPERIQRRLVRYWERLEAEHAIAPVQYVIVLAQGGGRLGDRFELGGLRLDYNVVHLWETPAQPLLDDPFLCPLATLAELTGGRDRTSRFEDVLTRIAAVTDAELREELAMQAATLAGVHVDRSTLTALLRRILAMPIDLHEHPFYQEGLEEGREGGREEGAASTLVRLLRRRFPTFDDQDAGLLRSLPAPRLDELTDRLLDLADLDELRTWMRGSNGPVRSAPEHDR